MTQPNPPKISEPPMTTNELPITTEALSLADIATVMQPQRLEQLLQQANAFIIVNSEQLDDFL